MSPSVSEAAREDLFLLLGALVAFGALAIDLYLPALPTIAGGLAATPEAVQLSINVFLAGFGFGMLFYGPVSDRHGLMHRERFVSFGGGLPVKHAGVRVGAIGISGGSEAQDIALGEAALAKWQEISATVI